MNALYKDGVRQGSMFSRRSDAVMHAIDIGVLTEEDVEGCPIPKWAEGWEVREVE